MTIEEIAAGLLALTDHAIAMRAENLAHVDCLPCEALKALAACNRIGEQLIAVDLLILDAQGDA